MSERPSSAIGFVDVLIGAMSAVLLVFMAQVSQPQKKTEFGGDQASIRISLDDRTTDPRPSLAVRFRVRSGKVLLDLAEARKQEPRVQLIGVDDGFADITIGFKRGARFEDDDVLLVYIHDLNGRPRAVGATAAPSPILLKATLTTETQTLHWIADEAAEPRPEFLPVLSATSPAMAVKLAEICGQGKVTQAQVKWRRL